MNCAHCYLVRLFVLLAVTLSLLLPSGFVVNCVGADGHQGSEILGVSHCDDSDTGPSTNLGYAADSETAFAPADDRGCTDTSLISEVFSRTDQDQSQIPALSPAPLLFVIDKVDVRFASPYISMLQNEPGTCPLHPSAIRCVILIV